MRAYLKMISLMVSENTLGLMEKFILVNGLMANRMVLEKILGLMEISILDHF